MHSGDSACAIPPQTLPSWVVEVIEAYTTAIADRLDVRGCINVQYAVTGTTVYVIEANPRASRTVPFVAKATGVPLAKVATRVMLGATLAELRVEGLLPTSVLHGADATRSVAVKEAVLPFSRFPEVDPALGPEMRSTGEVMGIDETFGRAFYKAELAAGTVLPTAGTVFLSLADGDKPAGLVVAKRLRELELGVVATQGTADYLARFGQSVDEVVAKVSEGAGKTAVDLIGDGAVVFVVNTPEGRSGAQRRRADPQGVHAAPGRLRDHGRRRAGRRPRPRRAAPPPHRGALTAGAPRPRRDDQTLRTADERVRQILIDGCRRADVLELREASPRPDRNIVAVSVERLDRVGHAGQPRHDGLRDGRVRHRAGPLPRPLGARRRSS